MGKQGLIENKLKNIFESYIEQEFFAGAVCQISLDGKTIYKQAFGKADVTTHQEMMVDSIFDLASITKIITTTIVLRLITDKKLSLTSKIVDLLPNVKKHDHLLNLLSNITIEQLLTHKSGLPAWYPFYSQKKSGDFYKVLEYVLTNSQLQNKAVYSDLNYMLLGEVIKEVIGDSLVEAIKQYIVKPLSLTTMTYGPIQCENVVATEFGNQIEQRMCNDIGVYFENWRETNTPIRGEVNDGNAYYFLNGISGHAGLFSNIEDITKVGELFIRDGRWKDRQLIDENLIQMSMKELQESRGLGWEVSDLFPSGCGHTGFTGTSLWIVPNKKIVVSILTNRLHVPSPKNINKMRREIHVEILTLV